MLREDDESANTVFLTLKVNHLEMIKCSIMKDLLCDIF